MKNEKRGGSPLAGLTVAVILLASTAGYVSALSRMFQAPLALAPVETDFQFNDVADTRAAVERAPADTEKSLGRTEAPAWLTNALPAYSSGSARIAWYSLLEKSGDRRTVDLSSGGYSNQSSSGNFILFDTKQVSVLAPTTSVFAHSSGATISSPGVPNAPTAPISLVPSVPDAPTVNGTT